MEIVNEKIVLGGMVAENLAGKYGSPLLVYETGIVGAQIEKLQSAFRYPDLEIFYSIKANSSVALLNYLRKLRIKVSASSPFELQSALKAGYSAFHVFYNGLNMPVDELIYCADKNLELSIDSLSLLKKYGERYRGTDVTLRINPAIATEGCIGQEAGADSPWGIFSGYIEQIRKIVSEYRLVVCGLYFHLGERCFSIDSALDALDVVLQMAEEFTDVRMINMGGGFTIPLSPAEEALELPDFGEMVIKKIQKFNEKTRRTLKLALEPGRLFLSGSGYLLATVVAVKNTPKYTFLCLDISNANYPYSLMRNEIHQVFNATSPTAEPQEYVLCGNSGEFDDFFYVSGGDLMKVSLPKVEEGDVLLLANMGAYGYSMLTSYGLRMAPAEVFVCDNKDQLVRKRQSFADVMSLQLY